MPQNNAFGDNAKLCIFPFVANKNVPNNANNTAIHSILEGNFFVVMPYKVQLKQGQYIVILLLLLH